MNSGLFGHTGEGHHMAYCRQCQTIVFMTQEERYSQLLILGYLNKQTECCDKPAYHFSDVILFNEINEKCPTCGQEVK